MILNHKFKLINILLQRVYYLINFIKVLFTNDTEINQLTISVSKSNLFYEAFL